MIILLNGPPRTGKDSVARHLASTLSFRHLKFATPLKAMTHAMYGIYYGSEAFDSVKDIKSPFFLGDTPRNAYIEVSEKMVKPVKGKDFFGRVALSTIEREKICGCNRIVFSDCGFAEEVKCLRHLQPILIRLHRAGHNFAGDSRDYIYDDNMPSIDLSGDDGLPALFVAVERIVDDRS